MRISAKRQENGDGLVPKQENGENCARRGHFDDFPVTLLIGELSIEEFSEIARRLTPDIGILDVDSIWDGKTTIVVVAMTEA